MHAVQFPRKCVFDGCPNLNTFHTHSAGIALYPLRPVLFTLKSLSDNIRRRCWAAATATSFINIFYSQSGYSSHHHQKAPLSLLSFFFLSLYYTHPYTSAPSCEVYVVALTLDPLSRVLVLRRWSLVTRESRRVHEGVGRESAELNVVSFSSFPELK